MPNWVDDIFAGGHVAQTDMQNFENNLGLLKNCFAGTSAPTVGVADGMWWLDTTNRLLKYRENSGWVSIWDFVAGGPVGGAGVPTSRLISAGAGMSGGGDLSADRTLTHAAHTGDVTGAAALAIASGAVDQDAIGPNAVGRGELKTTMQSINRTATGFQRTSCTGAGYCFAHMTQWSHAGGNCEGGVLWGWHGGLDTWGKASIKTSLSNGAWITLRNGNGSYLNVYVDVYYVQSSGELHWVWILMQNGEIAGMSAAPDHPAYGTGVMETPFSPEDYDVSKGDEIVLINPTLKQVAQVNARCLPKEGGGFLTIADIEAGAKRDYLKQKRPWTDAFLELFEIQESKQADWPDIPVTVALPDVYEGQIISDWRMMPQKKYDEDGNLVSVIIEPIKRVIARPDFVTPLTIKERVI